MEGYTSESPERESSPDSDENLEITNLESRQSSYETDTVIQPSEGPLFEAQYETNERIARISLLADRLDSYVRQARYKRFHDAYGEIQLGSITLGETELARFTDILQAPALKNNVNSIYCPTSETRKVLFVVKLQRPFSFVYIGILTKVLHIAACTNGNDCQIATSSDDR